MNPTARGQPARTTCPSGALHIALRLRARAIRGSDGISDGATRAFVSALLSPLCLPTLHPRWAPALGSTPLIRAGAAPTAYIAECVPFSLRMCSVRWTLAFRRMSYLSISDPIFPTRQYDVAQTLHQQRSHVRGYSFRPYASQMVRGNGEWSAATPCVRLFRDTPPTYMWYNVDHVRAP